MRQSDGISSRLRGRPVEVGPHGGDQPLRDIVLATETEHAEDLPGHSFEDGPGGLLRLPRAHAHQPLLGSPRAERKVGGGTTPGVFARLFAHLPRGRPSRVGVEQNHVERGGTEPVEQTEHVRCDLVGVVTLVEVTAVFGG
ncbi:hypothetical protein O1M54_40710 [Streptomyces diastatochromogenes]|nr:hypothetical protein [Streptomyces diastatochromogenes]